MLNVFIGKQKEGCVLLDVLRGSLHVPYGPDAFGDLSIDSYFQTPYVSIVSNPEEADYFLLPHSYASVYKDTAYVADFVQQAHAHKKKIIIFVIGDRGLSVPFDDVIVFRMSVYGFAMRTSDLVMPAYARDPGVGELIIRQKGARPVVGFCGFATIADWRGRLKQWLHNSFYDVLAFSRIQPEARARKRGIFYRRRVMRILSADSRIETRFTVRSFYSGSKKTLGMDSARAQQEYIENMQQSDFILTPKGDGNYSTRFYEVLSYGRIPVLIDTSVVLPLADMVDYDSFIVRISHKSIDSVADRISEYFSHMTDEEYEKKQRAARQAFVSYLRIDSYLRAVLTKEYLGRHFH